MRNCLKKWRRLGTLNRLWLINPAIEIVGLKGDTQDVSLGAESLCEAIKIKEFRTIPPDFIGRRLTRSGDLLNRQVN